MSTVCKRFGLSDNGLRKHCKSMNIPTPPIGYWSKLQNGKKTEIIPLPKDYTGKKQDTILHESDSDEYKEIDLAPPINRIKDRESEILAGDTSAFVVPEILYATDSIIIDTKEKFRQDSDNVYLKKSPFKNKLGPTLDLYVSEKSIDRALSIFATIINALRFRGHSIKISQNKTYAVIHEEEIQINITERRRLDPPSESSYARDSHFSGELFLNIIYGYTDFDTFRDKDSIKDTAHTKIEDKIITIIANLEIRSEKTKEKRIEEERRRIIREKEEREKKEFEERKKTEQNEFKALFKMAERLHKANILRHYIDTYEGFISQKGEQSDEISAKIKWAKEKIEWLDPFILKDDKYLDSKDIDKLINPECPKNNTWEYQNYSNSYEHSFWSSPYSKWR